MWDNGPALVPLGRRLQLTLPLKALALFERGAALHDPTACAEVAVAHLLRRGVVAPPGRVAHDLAVLAHRRGSGRGTVALALCHLGGVHGPVDAGKALSLARRAVTQDPHDPLAMAALARALLFDDSPTHHNEATDALHVAAHLGECEAAYTLGECYRLGRGVAMDEAEAIRCFELAASHHHGGAHFELGCYYDDLGDHTTAAAWFARGRAAGNADAANALGRPVSATLLIDQRKAA